MKLPEPRFDSEFSIERTLLKRRSIREFSSSPLTLTEISQLLWAAQGFTSYDGLRTTPSAGALYPLEVYIVSENVQNLINGIYKYAPKFHELFLIAEGSKLKDLAKAALEQEAIYNSSACIVFTAIYERVTSKYGKRGIRYVDMEVGHSAQNVHLQAEALNLGTVVIGAFHDERVKKVLQLPENEQPLYIMPVGRKIKV